MKFAKPLIPATLVRRYKRFLADCTLEDGQEITAHCPNPGSMQGLADAGMKVWLEPNDDPGKRLKYGWRLVDHGAGHFSCVDTSVPNRALRRALEAGEIAELAAYGTVRPEVKYGENSRVDFLLQQEGLPDCYVEVKSVTLMRQQGLAEFPDSVTRRGTRHLGELARVAEQGHRAVILYLVQRTDCHGFQVAADIDPGYARAAETAAGCGVERLVYTARISPQEITIAGALVGA
ncbi:MAG: DNA/RNA nuclease SfsA [Rhodobacterales bacterium]|nr:MAG: DNA/RNA nuclease SfsA [Rhodobacterales bacterium]